MPFAAVLWVLSAVAIIRAAWMAGHGHEGALRTGRHALAFLFIVAGAGVNATMLATGERYATFADGAPLAFVRHTWRSLVVPHHVAWIGLLIAFEVVVGLLALGGGRRPQLAYALAIAFHVGLLAFGWGFFLWAVPMIAAYATLLRGERRGVRPAPATARPGGLAHA